MAVAESLRDNFDDNSLAGQWTLLGPGTPSNQIKEINQRIEITTDGTSGNYYSLASTANYDLTGSYMFIQLVNAGAQAANQDCIPLIGVLDANNHVWFNVGSNSIQAWHTIGGAQNTVGSSFAYSSSVHRWFRIRESGGTTFWDWSTDGHAWFNWTSETNPFAVTSLQIGSQGGQFGAAASTTFMFDNFNVRMPLAVQSTLRPHSFSPGIAR